MLNLSNVVTSLSGALEMAISKIESDSLSPLQVEFADLTPAKASQRLMNLLNMEKK